MKPQHQNLIHTLALSLKKLGISFSDLHLLSRMWDEDQLIGQLAKAADASTAAMTGRVDAFEKKRLATRYQVRDRRTVPVKLTADGQFLLGTISVLLDGLFAEWPNFGQIADGSGDTKTQAKSGRLETMLEAQIQPSQKSA
jgi:DNA-binding MarR family transcriptional regulator